MLGGDDGRTLYMCTAPSALAAEVSTSRQGRIMTAPVATARAGLP
jgi:sugar lactone lactonase YvrE